jgi:hypothetical protein
MESVVDLKVQIEAIITKTLSIDTSAGIVQDGFSFTINLTNQTVKDLSGIVVDVEVIVTPKNKSEQVLIHSLVAFGYRVENFDQVYRIDDQGEEFINGEVINFVNEKSIDTMRGVLSCQVRGTIYEAATLPILSIESFK